MEIIIGCIVLAAAISGAIMFFVRRKLKSVRAERTACNYTRGDSFKTTNQRDTFLFNTISKIPIPRNNNRR